jgi:ribosomal protein L37AE/L43A
MDCTTCNSNPGEPTRVEFPDAGKTLEIWMCDDCYSDFRKDSYVNVVRLDG